MKKQNLANPFANIHPPQNQNHTPANPFANVQPQAQYQQPTQQYQQPVQPQQPQQPNQEEKKKKGKKKYLLLLLLLLLIPTIWFFKGSIGGDIPIITGINWNKDIEDGDLSRQPQEERIAALDESVREGLEFFTMNMSPTFENGRAKGTLRLLNISTNKHPHLVEIFTKDDNTLIFSGALDVGQKIEKTNLLVDLPKGTYDCLVYFHPIDRDTGAKLYTADFEITITVLN